MNASKTNRTDQYMLYILKGSKPRLRELIDKYVHSSMKYKIIVFDAKGKEGGKVDGKDFN